MSELLILAFVVGEIFLLSQTTDGIPQVQSQFLGKAITGLGGGCSKMFVIEGKIPKCFSLIIFKSSSIYLTMEIHSNLLEK